jgi:EpsI family protein
VLVSRRDLLLRALLALLLMVGAAALALAITPHHYLADERPREKLAQIIPRAFADWEIDPTVVPVPPSPDVQAVLDIFYDETLAVTYRNARGERIMLSLAYGRNQHKGMNTHRPEICYPAQGFKVVRSGTPGTIDFMGGPIPVTRLVTALGARSEPITYWLLVGDEITFFGYPQRWVTIRAGLAGNIPDGVLVRVSSIGADADAAFALQGRFIRDMLAGVDPARRHRLLGRMSVPS